MNGPLWNEERLAGRQKTVVRSYCELLVVHIQRRRRSGQLNGDIIHHRVGAWGLEIDGWESAGGCGHGRVERKLKKRGKKSKKPGGEGGGRGEDRGGVNELPLSI